MSETAMIRYGRKDPKGIRIGIQNRGKPVFTVCFSPQQEYICIQRSATEIEFTIMSQARTFIKTVRKPRESKILGIHWTFRTNLVVVTTHTVELYSVEESGQLKLLKYYNVDVNFYQYAARNKIMLIATGAVSSQLWNFVFKEDLVFRVPKFDLQFPLKSRDQLMLTQIYANVFILVIDSNNGLLRLYTLTKEAVKPAMDLNLSSKAPCAVNVVDNIIAVHNMEAKVTVLFDIQWIDPCHPISGPLPMTEIGSTTNNLYNGVDVRFILPNVMIDEKAGMLWTLDLRVSDLVRAMSSTKPVHLLQFLVRRARSKQLILEHLRKLILSSAPLSTLAEVFDVLTAIVAALPVALQKQLLAMSPVRIGSNVEGGSDTGGNAVTDTSGSGGFVPRRTTKGQMIIDQRDMYADVFSMVASEVDEHYFSKVMIEYLRSLMSHKVEVEHFLHEMLIMVLVKNKWYTQLQMLLQYHVVDDSAPVAYQLLSIKPSSDYPAAEQLALDMLQRLRKYEAMVDILVARGEILAALRLISETKTKFPVDPQRFLDAASNEPRAYFTVFRFFESRGFKAKSEDVQKFSKQFAIGRT